MDEGLLVPGTFSHVVFRLRHNCPLALLSQTFPEVLFLSWTTHRQEIIQAVTRSKDESTRLAQAFRDRLPKCQTLPFEGGLLAIHPILWPQKESISWQLEAHHALWLQPLRCRGGWEYFDVVSLEADALQEFLTGLLKQFPLEIVRRGRVGGKELASSFFVPLNPVMAGLSAKQMEAILRAIDHGYYEQPRHTTTRDVAKALGLSRSAFEERLRNAENLVIRGALVGATVTEDAAADRGPRKASRAR